MIPVLCVDDEPAFLDSIRICLEKGGEFSVAISPSAEDALLRLEASSYEVVISGYRLPGMDGLEFLKVFREKYPHLPFILFTGTGGEEVAIEALDSGADFYIRKDPEHGSRFAVLISKVRQMVRVRAAEKELAESRQEYRELVENISEVPYMLNAQGVIISVSPAVSRFGYDTGNLAGRPFMDLVVPEDRAVLQERLQGIRNGDAEAFEVRIRSPQGRIFQIRGSGCTIVAGGQFTGIRGVLTDVTAQKETQDVLKAGTGYFHDIIDNAPVGIFHAGPEGMLTDSNPAFARIFGCDSGEDAVGMVNRQGGVGILFSGPEERPDPLRQDSEPGGWQRFEARLRRKDGSGFTGLLAVRLCESSGIISGLDGFVVDVTGGNSLQERVAAEEQQYRTIFDAAGEAMLVIDENEGTILDANRAALALYRYTLSELRGMNSAALVTSPDPGARYSFLSFGASPLLYHRKKDGTRFPVEVSESTVTQNGRTICILTVRDISGRKRAGDRIQAVSRLSVMLARTNEAIVRVRDLETLLGRICRIAVQYGHFRMAWIGLVDREKGVIRPVAHAGFEEGYLAAVPARLDASPDGVGPAGSAYQSGCPVFIQDIATDPCTDPWRDEALQRSYRSMAALPFSLHGEIVGVISLYALSYGFFTDENVKLLTRLAEDVSFALGLLDEQARRARMEHAPAGSGERARFLASVLETSSQPFFIGYEDGRIAIANKAFCDLLGYDEPEIKNLSWKDLTPRESAAMEEEELRILGAAGGPRRYEKEFFRKDTSRVVVEILVHRTADSTGNNPYLSLFVTDITERKKVLCDSRQIREGWERTISAMESPTLILDPAGTIVQASGALIRLSGKSRDELLTMKCWQVFPKLCSTTPAEGCPLGRMESGGVHGTALREVPAFGGTYLVSCIPVMDRSGSTERVVLTGTDITSRKHAEQALSESETKYRTIFWKSPDAVILMDRIILDCNPAAEKLWGLPRDRIIGHHPVEFSPLFQPDGTKSEEAAATYNLAAYETGPQFFPWQYRSSDGRLIESDVSLSSVIVGRERRLIAVIRDVSARRHAEVQLEESERTLRLITESFSDMVWLSDLNLFPIFVSPSVVRHQGYPLEELQQLPLDNRLSPESCVLIQEIRDHLLAASHRKVREAPPPVTIELEFCKKGGGTFWSENVITLIRDNKGKPLRILIVGRDITGRKEIENRIRRLASFSDLSPAPIIEIGPDKEITYANPACLSMLEKLRMPGNPAAFLPADIGEVVVSLQKSRSIGAVIREVTVGDAVFEEFLTLSPGGLTVRAYAHDITSRQQDVSALARANRKLHLLTGITRHDISNRLTAVLGYTDLARSSTSDPALQDFLNRTEAAAVGIRQQIEFTKEYENFGSGVPVWHDLSVLINAARTNPDLHDAALIDDVAGVSIYADPMFSRVIQHLVENALRHGGSNLTRIRFSGSVTPEGYVLVCEDDGAGIPKKDKAAVFRRVIGEVSRTGLFLAQEILSLTMITIRETGEPGKGARFELTVPSGIYRLGD